MSAIILGYLAVSYTFSGLICWLTSLTNSRRQFHLVPLSKYPASSANLVVAFLWPIWVWQEIHQEHNLPSNSIYCPPIGCQSLAQGNSSFRQKQFKRLRQDNLTISRIKIQVSKTYLAEPVISRLTSEYGLTFNITEARLKADRQEDGLFQLELLGTPQQIQMALDYLVQKEVKIWGKPNADGDSW